MAKIIKTKLSWTPSGSDLVVSYKLYWSKGKKVSYDSNYFELGDVNEVYLPDVLKHVPRYGEPIMLGISASDRYGNESDITILTEPYQPMVPPAPEDLLLTTQDEFYVDDQQQESLNGSDELIEEDTRGDELKELARIAEPLLKS